MSLILRDGQRDLKRCREAIHRRGLREVDRCLRTTRPSHGDENDDDARRLGYERKSESDERKVGDGSWVLDSLTSRAAGMNADMKKRRKAVS